MNSAPSKGCPYNDLYIYYLKGRAQENLLPEAGTFLGNWEEEGFSFLFFSEKEESVVQKILKEQKELELIDSYMMTYEEWLGEKPVTRNLGRFIVSPSWDMPDRLFLPDFGAFHLILDPGVVFGTGTHPTTHDCLELIESAVKNMPTKSVIDLGTGTGLLAMAAAKFRCRNILAVDFNYLAVKTAYKNILLNNLGDRILAVRGLAQDFVETNGDLLIANIHYDVMMDIISSPGFLKKKQFILSGLLRSQARIVEKRLGAMPVEILEKRSRNGVWFTFYGKSTISFP